MAFDKTSYDINYAKENIIRKMITFNRKLPEDLKLLQWAESHGNFIGYVKSLIAADLEKAGKQDAPTAGPASRG